MCPPKPKTPPPPAGPPPIPTKSAADVAPPPEARPTDSSKAKQKRLGRSSLRTDLQIPGAGAGLSIPVV